MDAQKFKDSINATKDNLNKNQMNDQINQCIMTIQDSLDARKGEDNALDIVREECAEFIQAVSKMIRFGEEDDWYHLLEEYADVMIALEVVKHIYHIDKSEINNAYLVKLKRMVGKIRENGGIIK